MNIVMLSKRNPDYLHDALYQGFRKLGHTVVDHPRKANLHAGHTGTGFLTFSWDTCLLPEICHSLPNPTKMTCCFPPQKSYLICKSKCKQCLQVVPQGIKLVECFGSLTGFTTSNVSPTIQDKDTRPLRYKQQSSSKSAVREFAGSCKRDFSRFHVTDSTELTEQGDVDLLLVCAQPADYQDSLEEYQAMLNEALYSNPKKIAIVDGHDVKVMYPGAGRPYDALFKRELLLGEKQLPDTVNLPLVAFPETIAEVPYREREIDFIFAGSYSGQPFRMEMLRALQEISIKNELKSVCTLDPMPRSEYLSLVGKSRLVVSVRGYGWDCYRYWETPALGAVMLTETIPIEFANDFENGTDCFKFATGDLAEMERMLLHALGLPSYLLRVMADNALAKTKAFHTPEHRAQLVLDTLFGTKK